MKPADVAALTKALRDDAQRLGLIWVRRYGTVTTATATGIDVQVLMDGDDTSIDCVSIVGPLLPGARVVVDSVPPAGKFVVGVLSNAPYTGRRMLAFAEVAASGDLTLGTSAADVPGCTVSGTLLVAGFYRAFAVCLFQYTVAGASLAAGTLVVDGVTQTAQPVFDSGNATSTPRATVAQQWTGALTAGAHTIKLQALKSAVAATILARGTNTTLMVEFWLPTL